MLTFSLVSDTIKIEAINYSVARDEQQRTLSKDLRHLVVGAPLSLDLEPGVFCCPITGNNYE